MTEIQVGSIRKIFCNSCKAETKHEVLAKHSRRFDEVEGEDMPYPNLVFWEEWEYRFWVCRGCDTATLEVAYTNPGMYDAEKKKDIYESIYHPQREKRAWVKHFLYLDQKLRTAYREVIACFNADSKIACAMCLRALLEGICVNKGITDETAWSLEEKLKKLQLQEGNRLPPSIMECLLSFKFIGDDAAHRLVPASQDELELAITVMEDLLSVLYEVDYRLAYKAQKLAKMRSAELEKFKKRKTSTEQAKNKKSGKKPGDKSPG